MGEFLSAYRDWLIAFHIIAVMFWMAGLYYLPRLFIYHAESIEQGEEIQIFRVMEQKLLRIIINPAMIAAWAFGLLLLFSPGFIDSSGIWLGVKLASVTLLAAYHGFLARIRKQFLTGQAPHSSSFFRKINEIPPLLTILIVIMVIIRPF